jgi:two-component system chemotaxis response regulator CheY
MAVPSVPYELPPQRGAFRDWPVVPALRPISGVDKPVQTARIVVADDCAEECRLLALMLHYHGFDVVQAEDGDAALGAILSYGADALVSDLQMPNVDGLTLCRILRGLRAYATLPIVVFTGADSHDSRRMPLHDIEGLRVLTKPRGLFEIVPALVEMIATNRQPRAAWIEEPVRRTDSPSARRASR